jgi:outer membrane lipoprotein SlyB
VPVYRDRYYRPQGHGSATLPIVAGGILGGIVGNEAGYGNPAAIIGGSVLGSVLGHEIARR